MIFHGKPRRTSHSSCEFQFSLWSRSVTTPRNHARYLPAPTVNPFSVLDNVSVPTLIDCPNNKLTAYATSPCKNKTYKLNGNITQSVQLNPGAVATGSTLASLAMSASIAGSMRSTVSVCPKKIRVPKPAVITAMKASLAIRLLTPGFYNIVCWWAQISDSGASPSQRF